MMLTTVPDAVVGYPQENLSPHTITRRGMRRPTKRNKTVRAQKATITDMERERRRVKQARYRKKQYAMMKSLDEGTQSLKEEIQRLEVQRENVCADTRSRPTAWTIAADYINLFRRGIASMSTTQSRVLTRPLPSPHQIFLEASMCPEVAHNAGYGTRALLESWHQFSLCFDAVEITLDQLRKGPGGSLIAATTTTIIVTENTLLYAFPHLWTWPYLAAKFLHQQLVVYGCIRFEWDETNCRVVSVLSRSDLMTPMLELLGNLDDVNRVFLNANVRLDLTLRHLLK